MSTWDFGGCPCGMSRECDCNYAHPVSSKDSKMAKYDKNGVCPYCSRVGCNCMKTIYDPITVIVPQEKSELKLFGLSIEEWKRFLKTTDQQRDEVKKILDWYHKDWDK